MPVSPARAVAFDVLTRVEAEGAYAADALLARLGGGRGAGARRRSRLRLEAVVKREDAALATELTFGVLRWQRLLDFLIERQANRPAAELDPGVRRALRLGAYQLLFLDRIPASAAVNEAVELTRVARKKSAAGFVNAVLRRLPCGAEWLAQLARSLPGEMPEAERLGILYSHPGWMVERWLEQFGGDGARALLEANNQPLPVACAVLDPAALDAVRDSLEADGFAVEPGRLLRRALLIRGGGNPLACRAFRRGWIALQDEASQAVTLLAGVEGGQSVLDVCAAPGNKTLHLALAAGPKAMVAAGDIHPSRLRAVRAQLRRAHVAGVKLVAMDAARPLPFARRFDRILIDAPCSGTGTLARNPEIRWRLAPEDIEELAGRQVALLANAAERLAPGGRLVYATCSLERDENQQVVRRVMAARGDLRLAPPPAAFAASLAGDGEEAVRKLFDPEGFFRTLPWETGTDGFFAAILERNSEL
ncbi:MAG TPA: 16S rRNA (cytosine(967)-C(5))-methyltransferase RsmB [Candidatus Acidoferrales bacterium]|nr:16S rRNA (cytosine(967)-C(5))-methyltransferase RsmB [Candidatus Acidoferrales bacterium]